jgi:hypothetical protein
VWVAFDLIAKVIPDIHISLEKYAYSREILKDWLKDMENAYYQSIVEHGVPQTSRFMGIKHYLPLACENRIIESKI